MDLPIRYLKSLGWFLVILIPGTVASVVVCTVFGHPAFRIPPGPGWDDGVIHWNEFAYISTWSANLLPDGIKFGTSLFLIGQCMSLWGYSERVRTACLTICGGVSCLFLSAISGLGMGLAARVTFVLAMLGMIYGAMALPRWTRARTDPPPRPWLKLGAGIILGIQPLWFLTKVTYEPFEQKLELTLYQEGSPGPPCLDGVLPDSAEMAWLDSQGRDGTRLCAVFRSLSGPFGTTNQATLGIILDQEDTGEVRFAIPRRTRALYLETDSGSQVYPQGFRRLERHVRIKRMGGGSRKWHIRREPDTTWETITAPARPPSR